MHGKLRAKRERDFVTLWRTQILPNTTQSSGCYFHHLYPRVCWWTCFGHGPLLL